MESKNAIIEKWEVKLSLLKIENDLAAKTAIELTEKINDKKMSEHLAKLYKEQAATYDAKAQETAATITIYEEVIDDLRQLTNTKSIALSLEEQAKRKEKREKRKLRKEAEKQAATSAEETTQKVEKETLKKELPKIPANTAKKGN